MRQTSSAECMCSRCRKTQCDAFCLRCCNYTSHQVCIYNVFSYLRIYIAHRGYRQEKNWWTGRAFYSQLPWWASHLCDIENANFRLNLANPLMSLRSTPLRCSALLPFVLEVLVTFQISVLVGFHALAFTRVRRALFISLILWNIMRYQRRH